MGITPLSNPAELSDEEQKRISQPLGKQSGLDAADVAFIGMVVDKVDRGEINLLVPSSLVNTAVYSTLTEQEQGTVDFDAINLCASLRTMYGLWKTNPNPTYEIENMVRTVRLTKERLEGISGDVFVI